MHTWVFWFLIELFIISSALTIMRIGKPRGVTPGVALCSILINAVVIVALFMWGTVR